MTRLRRWLMPLAACLLLSPASGCGLPGDEDVRSIHPDDVPYDLLEVEPAVGSALEDTPVPPRVPVTFWVSEDERLAPAVAAGSCSDPPEDLADHLLTQLDLGPDDRARNAGRSSALPPNIGLRLVSLDGPVARVEVEPGTPISADLLPLAIGQIVLSLTSSPGVAAVVFQSSGQDVEVPVAGGALVARPVSEEDYADLVPARYLGSSGSTLTAGLGCR